MYAPAPTPVPTSARVALLQAEVHAAKAALAVQMALLQNQLHPQLRQRAVTQLGMQLA